MEAATRVVRGVLAIVLATTALLAGAGPSSAQPADTATSCRAVAFPVAARVVVGPVNLPVPNQTWTIRGTYCAPDNPRAVQLLLSGITYGSRYWNWGYQPERYSFTRKANAAGYATLNIDRLGIGASSHPAPELVTTDAEVMITHLLVGALRDGTFGHRYTKVGLVAHSYGSVIAMSAAGRFHDVDGVVLTGFTHEFGSGFLTDVLASFAPASTTDPRFAGLPPGYLSTRPGTRGGFYYTPNAEPAVLAYDETTKQTITDGELATFAGAFADSLNVTAPVLTLVGERDQLVCGPVANCSNPLSLTAAERALFPRAADYTFQVVPDAGHDVILHRNAAVADAAVNTWFAAHVA